MRDPGKHLENLVLEKVYVGWYCTHKDYDGPPDLCAYGYTKEEAVGCLLEMIAGEAEGCR